MSLEYKKELFQKFIDIYFILLKMMKERVGYHNDFYLFYKKNKLLRKTNIKMFIKTWYESITLVYYKDLMNQPYEYFLENGSKFLPDISFQKYFNEFKQKCLQTEKEVIENAYNMVKQLTELSRIYYQDL